MKCFTLNRRKCWVALVRLNVVGVKMVGKPAPAVTGFFDPALLTAEAAKISFLNLVNRLAPEARA